MKKTITTSILAICISANSFALNLISAGAGPANYNLGASWINTVTMLPAVAAPTIADNCTIQAGHTMTISAAAKANNLTVSGTLQWNANVILQVNTNYTLSAAGIEKNAGQIQFIGGGGILTVTGTVGASVKYIFSANRTISASSVINKSTIATQIALAKIVTNLGNCTIGSMVAGATSKWINGANSSLTLTSNGFLSTSLFDPSGAGNTVTLNFAVGFVPATTGGYSNLVISGAGLKNLLAATVVVAKNLTINLGATLSANTKDLKVGGNWSKSGTFTASTNHFVEFNGSSAQTIAGSGTTTFEQLTINNTSGGVQITSGTYVLNDVLTATSGDFNANGNSFTLISTAVKTARLGQTGATGSYSGNFTINRFITTRDTTWSDLSSPVQSTTFNDWDNELPAIYYTFNPPFNFPTQYYWSEPANNLIPITASGTTLTAGQGYEVWLAGDFLYNDLPATTINTIGTPNYGNQNLTSLISFTAAYPAGSSNLVGNPFASSIAWNTVLAASSNLDPTYDIFDKTTGAYANFGAGTEIGSAQGFWVYTLSGAATLIVNENAKTTTSNSTIKSVVAEPYFKLKFACKESNNSYSQILKVSANSESTNGFDPGKDHPYRKSPVKTAPAIYTTLGEMKSVINFFNSDNNSYDMPISTLAGVSGYYSLDASGFENLSDYTCISLEDKLLNKIIDLNATPSYTFKLNVSDNENRFVVHFSKDGNCKSLINANKGGVYESQVEILPTTFGNVINFNFPESTPSSISLTNVLGQTLVDVINVDAFNQSVNVTLPEGYSGLYFIKVESANNVVTKKFVKK